MKEEGFKVVVVFSEETIVRFNIMRKEENVDMTIEEFVNANLDMMGY